MATERRLFAAALLAAAVLLAGCGSIAHINHHEGTGLLYTHTVEPLSLDHHAFNNNGTSTAKGHQDTIHVQYVTIKWDSNAIGEIAKKNGIRTILYADMEYERLLFGLWSRKTVHIYGYGEQDEE